MLEQYIFNLITADTTLKALLTAGGGKYHLYPAFVPRGITITKAVTFSTVITTDVFPASKSKSIQFNIFATAHSDIVAIADALDNLFNGDNHKTSGNISVVYSQRRSESDLPYDTDEAIYQREATYYFKIR